MSNENKPKLFKWVFTRWYYWLIFWVITTNNFEIIYGSETSFILGVLIGDFLIPFIICWIVYAFKYYRKK